MCADIASVLGLRYAVKFVSFQNLKGSLRTESLRLLAISSQFSVTRSVSLVYFLNTNPAHAFCTLWRRRS